MSSESFSTVAAIRSVIRDVLDFPTPGIVFKDVTPLLNDGPLFRDAVELMATPFASMEVGKVMGVEARGFIFGVAVAQCLGVGFVPVRKKGKLPWKTLTRSYELEYGNAELELHTDAIRAGEKVLLVDDLLATGGTAAAAIDLAQSLGGEVVGASFLIELAFLHGREHLKGVPNVHSLIPY